MKNESEEEFRGIIKRQEWLMDALKSVRDLDLSDWYIAAGAIRNAIWNYLHDFPTTLNQQDVDVAYFDVSDRGGNLEKISEEKLRNNHPHLKWEVVNQARGHLFEHGGLSRPKVNSSCESIAYWSETSTCIGVRLEGDDSLTICAPHGLNDLMNLVVRPVPIPYQNLSLYNKRLSEKAWKDIWPKLKVHQG